LSVLLLGSEELPAPRPGRGCVASALVAAVDVLLPVIGLAILALGSMTPVPVLEVVLLVLPVIGSAMLAFGSMTPVVLSLSRVDLAGVGTDVRAASSNVCCLPPKFGSWGAVLPSAFTAPGCSGFC
jgi:hypothetical protein